MSGLMYGKILNVYTKLNWVITVFFFCVQFSYGQNVGIGTTSPTPSAQLEVKSTTKGFLMPRMTTAQRNAIVSPAVGLQIFNLDDQCMDIYDGTNWIKNCGLKMTGSTIDPTTNVWTKMAGPDPNTYDIVYGTFSFAINGKGYVLGLNNSNASFNLFEYSSADNRWVQKANFPGEPRDLAVVFAIGNKGYFGGGQGLQNGDLLKDFWEYDPVLNIWTQKGNYKGIPIAGAVGFSVGNKGYVVAGADNNQNYDSVWQYEPSNDTGRKKIISLVVPDLIR